jgi:hypothetical protein
MPYRIILDRQDHGTMTNTEANATKEEAQRELIRVLAADYNAHGGTFPDGANLVGGAPFAALDPMREPPGPGEFRGSGAVTCCGHHKERCTFGRSHLWSTWFEVAVLQRTATTLRCYECGGVCVAEEETWPVDAGREQAGR